MGLLISFFVGGCVTATGEALYWVANKVFDAADHYFN